MFNFNASFLVSYFLLGGSYSSYDNARATTYITGSVKTVGSEYSLHIEAGLGPTFDISVCAGLFATVCKKIGDGTVLVQPTFDGVWSSDIVQETDNTVAVTYDFSYATSADPEDAGPMSDMFLVPAMNIVYSKSVLIGFDSTGCAGTTTDIYTWSLSSPKNFPVCASNCLK